MITPIKREEGLFAVPVSEWEDRAIYFKGENDKGVYFYLHVQILKDMAYLHIRVEKFGAEVVKSMRQDLSVLKKDLAMLGIKRIIGTHIKEGSAKWGKFLRLIGFPAIQDASELLGEGAKMTYMEI